MIRGEIWVVNLDQTTGAEIGKQRPAFNSKQSNNWDITAQNNSSYYRLE